MIRVRLPPHLKKLAGVSGDVSLELGGLGGPVTQRAVLDALEARFPMLRGTIRHADTGRRRSLVRFFACGRDVSHEAPETPLPTAVVEGDEPFVILGAMAGG